MQISHKPAVNINDVKLLDDKNYFDVMLTFFFLFLV